MQHVAGIDGKLMIERLVEAVKFSDLGQALQRRAAGRAGERFGRIPRCCVQQKEVEEDDGEQEHASGRELPIRLRVRMSTVAPDERRSRVISFRSGSFLFHIEHRRHRAEHGLRQSGHRFRSDAIRQFRCRVDIRNILSDDFLELRIERLALLEVGLFRGVIENLVDLLVAVAAGVGEESRP